MMRTKSRPQSAYNSSVELEYGLKLSDITDLMQLKSIEATQKIHQDLGGIEGIAQKLNTNIVTGLNDITDNIDKRKFVFGRNEIPPKPSKLFIELVYEALQDPTLIILLGAAIISIGLSFYTPPATAVIETQVKPHSEGNDP
jgi:Ca2+ transporting ATPase